MKNLNQNRCIAVLPRANTSKKVFTIIALLGAINGGLLSQVSYCTNNCGLAGSDNAVFGTNSMGAGVTGNYNSAFGRYSLLSNTTGSSNCGFGGSTLGYNTSGSSNAAVGHGALGNNTTAHFNTAVGTHAAGSLNTGQYNTAIGGRALYSATTATGQVAIGYRALYNATSNNALGNSNHAVGFEALFSTTSGLQNTAFGQQTLYNNTTGHNNTGMGLITLQSNTSGGDNTAVGCVALSNNTTGSNNTAYGTLALNTNGTGSNNTAIGRGADVSANNLTNASAFGYNTIVNASNKIRVGDANVTVCEAPVVWTSDGRFKYNISESDVVGLDFIKRLRPVVYNFDSKKFTEFLTKNMTAEQKKKYLDQDFSAATDIRQTGFIAQEVEKAAAEAGYNFNGVVKPKDGNDNYSLAYAHFVVPMVKAIQEQQKMIEDLQAELRSVKGSQSVNSIHENSLQGLNMEQNVPNPFTHETLIKYNLSDGDVKSAQMIIFDMSGKQVSKLDLNSNADSIVITSEHLSAGMYIYSIVADGKLVDSKRMIVAEK